MIFLCYFDAKKLHIVYLKGYICVGTYLNEINEMWFSLWWGEVWVDYAFRFCVFTMGQMSD